MTTEDLIRDLRLWVQTLPKLRNEAELQTQVLEKLQTMRLSYCDRGKLENPRANGVSQPDVLVTCVDPQLLIEIKADGDWKSASHAAWQLFQAAELLKEDGIKTRKLAIFGGKLSDPLLLKMLEALDIASECVQF